MNNILKTICLLLILSFCTHFLRAQERITGLYSNKYVAELSKKKHLVRKTNFIYYEPILLPFIDDFSNYSGYPDTSLWIGKQAFVSDGFAKNPPSLGCVSLDALNEFGAVYEHASTSSFGADTLLSRPIRLDSIFSPLPRPLEISDSVYFSFFYQPGGGEGFLWERSDAPDAQDSLILEFGYQTGNIELLYYITQEMYLPDSVDFGDTIKSPCNSNLYIIADRFYYAGEIIEIPCDSVTGMEIIWERVWASPGMTLADFKEQYGTYFRQIMIPIVEQKYFNKGFQFRFRNLASLEYSSYSPSLASNVDVWNIDYIRLNRARTIADTIIDDIAIVQNPGSILKNYTAMPWSHFSTNKSAFLRSDFDLKLTNLYNATKNTTYEHRICDENGNEIGRYSGGSYNINPFYQGGYQDYAPHAKPSLATINFSSTQKDSCELFIYHIFKEAGTGDKNQKNDTAFYHQCFYNYFAYDDGIPESGYEVAAITPPYKTSLAVGFNLSHPDTLRAVRMYINRALNDANSMDFTLTIWEDNNGEPGNIIHSEIVNQNYSEEIYGLQQFYLQNPILVSGRIYVGYQLSGKPHLNIGYDMNNDAHEHVFWKTNQNWEESFYKGTPIIRPVVGADFDYLNIKKVVEQKPFFVQIFPNPAQEKITLSISEDVDIENAKTEIFSANGQCLFNGKTNKNLDVSFLQNGFYLLKITDEKGCSAWAKFVIVK